MFSTTRSLRAALAATYLLTVVASSVFHTHGPQPCDGPGGCAIVTHGTPAGTDVSAANAPCLHDLQRDGHGVETGDGGCAVCRFLAQHRVVLPPAGETARPLTADERASFPPLAVHVPVVPIWHSRAPPAAA